LTVSVSKDLRKEFSRQTRKRVRDLKDTFKDAVRQADSNAIHEFRKTTRHLQTIVDACGIRSNSRRVEKLRDRLRQIRHAGSDWRDSDVMIEEVSKARRKTSAKADRRCWARVAKRTAKQRRRAIRNFVRQCKSRVVKKTGAKIRALVKRNTRSEPLMDELRLLLQHAWEKWNASINDFVSQSTATRLHNVRIKTKTLKYAIDLNQRFFPDRDLEKANLWLTDIQDRVGAWHDEFMLGRFALKTFRRKRSARDPAAVKIIRRIKEREIILAESARRFISNIGDSRDYAQLHRVLAAEIFAMSEPSANGTDSLAAPL
jgi:hypothetical protein